MSTGEVPPWLREQLARFDQLQQNLQAILVQKQGVEAELSEIEKATDALRKSTPEDTVYKSAGNILIRVNREELLKELEDRKELANTRVLVLGKQETRVRESVKELQGKIEQMVKGRGTQPPEN
jgi:prefoldin beta subunit